MRTRFSGPIRATQGFEVGNDGNSSLTASGLTLQATSSDQTLITLRTLSSDDTARFRFQSADNTRYFSLATTFDPLQVVDMQEHVTISSESTTIMSFARNGQVFLNASLGADAPHLARKEDADSGIYFPGGNYIGVATGGVRSALFYSTGFAIKGTTTNDSSSAGDIGEWLESAVTSDTAVGTTAQYWDATSKSLTAGDYDVAGWVRIDPNGGTVSAPFEVAISTTAGNSSTGLDIKNALQFNPPSSTSTVTSGVVPMVRISLAATTTIYLKCYLSYSGSPLYRAALVARRVR